MLIKASEALQLTQTSDNVVGKILENVDAQIRKSAEAGNRFVNVVQEQVEWDHQATDPVISAVGKRLMSALQAAGYGVKWRSIRAWEKVVPRLGDFSDDRIEPTTTFAIQVTW